MIVDWDELNTSVEVSGLTQVPEVFTSDKIIELCGAWDSQALIVAWSGLLLSLAMMFYFFRWRKYVKNDIHKVFIDKFLFVSLMMFWVIVIVRMMRAG